jgi:hypothetical protein
MGAETTRDGLAVRGPDVAAGIAVPAIASAGSGKTSDTNVYNQASEGQLRIHPQFDPLCVLEANLLYFRRVKR